MFDHTPAVDPHHPAYRAVVFGADWLLDRLALRPGMKLLEVAAGNGALALGALQRVGETGRVVVVDPRAEALADLYARVRAAGLADRLDAHDMPAERLDFRSGYFDALAAYGVLGGLADPVRVLRRWLRVVRPGGILAASVWAPGGEGEKLLAARYGTAVGGLQHHLAMARQAGWADVGGETRPVGYELADPQQWWEAATAGWQDAVGEDPDLKDRCLALAQRPDGSVRLEWVMHLIWGRRPEAGRG